MRDDCTFTISLSPESRRHMGERAWQEFIDSISAVLIAAAKGLTPVEQENFRQQMHKERAIIKSSPTRRRRNVKISIYGDGEGKGEL